MYFYYKNLYIFILEELTDFDYTLDVGKKVVN